MSCGAKMAWLGVSLVVVAWAAETRAAEPTDDPECPILANDGFPLRLEVELRDRGESPHVAWRGLLGRLHADFDRDGDGGLDHHECQLMMALPLPGNQQLRIDFGQADRDENSRVDPAELAAFCAQAGFVPIVEVFQPASESDRSLAALLTSRLDRDQDGLISLEELRAAPESLRPLDLNEDEVWERDELLLARKHGQPPPSESDQIMPPTDAMLRVEWNETGSRVTLSAEKSRNIVSSSNNCWHDEAGKWMVTVRASRSVPPMNSASEFLLAQFRTSAGTKSTIPLEQITKRAELSSLRELAPLADRNEDALLSANELEAYTRLVADLVQHQIWIVATDCDRNLFPALDADGDGRLSYAELSAAGKVVPVGGKPPRQFTISFGAVPARVYGGMLIPAVKPLPRVTGNAKAESPTWFDPLDRNDDGILSPREFVGPPAVFQRLDQNGDGMISPHEAAAK